MTDKIVALSTCDSEESATALASALVEERLAACVNIVPGIRSIYRWQSAIADDAEFLLIIKTRRDQLEPLRKAIARLHTYDVPELIVLPIVDGAESYLAWLDAEVDG